MNEAENQKNLKWIKLKIVKNQKKYKIYNGQNSRWIISKQMILLMDKV